MEMNFKTGIQTLSKLGVPRQQQGLSSVLSIRLKSHHEATTCKSTESHHEGEKGTQSHHDPNKAEKRKEKKELKQFFAKWIDTISYTFPRYKKEVNHLVEENKKTACKSPESKKRLEKHKNYVDRPEEKLKYDEEKPGQKAVR